MASRTTMATHRSPLLILLLLLLFLAAATATATSPCVVSASSSVSISALALVLTSVATAVAEKHTGEFPVAVLASVPIPVAVPASAPVPEPVRIMGTRPKDKLPDESRCRWLESGPDVWVANNGGSNNDSNNNNNNNDNNHNHNTEAATAPEDSDLTQQQQQQPPQPTTLDAAFRKIIRMVREDEDYRDTKLTIASSPDALPPKTKSDYAKPDAEFGEDNSNDKNGTNGNTNANTNTDDNDNDKNKNKTNVYRDDDDDVADEINLDWDDDGVWDPYHLRAGDGGPWVLVIDDFLSDEETQRLMELGTLEGFTKSTIIDLEKNEENEDEGKEENDLDEFEDNDHDDDAIVDNNKPDTDSNLRRRTTIATATATATTIAIEGRDSNPGRIRTRSNVTSQQQPNATETKSNIVKIVTIPKKMDQTSTAKIVPKPRTGRTSSTAWCKSEACRNDGVHQRVTDRIYRLVGMDISHTEHLQLLHYEKGQYYSDHNDFYHIPDTDRWNQDGGRILTVFLYLNDVDGGGETNFPRLNITVTPRRGRVVIWPSVLDSDPRSIDWRTEHAALPVTNGVKHGANLWFHLKPFRHQWFNYECDHDWNDDDDDDDDEFHDEEDDDDVVDDDYVDEVLDDTDEHGDDRNEDKDKDIPRFTTEDELRAEDENSTLESNGATADAENDDVTKEL